MPLYSVRSPFPTTSTLGLNNCSDCPNGPSAYCHKSRTYGARSFDVAPEPRVAANVYARLLNGTLSYAYVYARAYRYQAGVCGVDVDIRSAAGTRRVRYYHVQPISSLPAAPSPPGAGAWQIIGSMGAFGSGSFLLGTVYTSGPCQPPYDPDRPPFVHVHIDLVDTETSVAGDYEWINCSLVPDGSLSSATDLFHI